MAICKFCDLLNKTATSVPVYDTILHETENFVVIPALGAFSTRICHDYFAQSH